MKHSSMYRPLFFFLLFALAAYGQQKRIAIINTVDDGEEPIPPRERIYPMGQRGGAFPQIPTFAV